MPESGTTEGELQGPRSAASEDASHGNDETKKVVEISEEELLAEQKKLFSDIKDEICVSAEGDVEEVVKTGVKLFKEDGKKAVVVRGSGKLVGKAVDTANGIFRSVPDLEISTNTGGLEMPTERVSGPSKRVVSFISILLKAGK